jgi:hypothetical protein
MTSFESCKDCVPGRAPIPDTFDSCVCDAKYFNTSVSSKRGASMIKCYLDGQDVVPDAELAAATDDCQLCSSVMMGEHLCVDCDLGRTSMIPGHSLSETKLSQSVDFDTIAGQRGVFKCPLGVDACTGVPSQPCTEMYTGPLCTVCKEGYSRKGLQGECTECLETMSGVWTVFGALLAIGLATAALWLFSGPSETFGTMHTIIVFVKITISLVQIVSQLEVALTLRFPDVFRWFVDLLKVFSFDILAFIDIGCLTTYSYYQKFAFAFLVIRTSHCALP